MKENSIEKVRQYLQQLREDPSLGAVPTGYAQWDQLTGGLVCGGLTVIAGRPAMGRRALALNIVSRLAKCLSGTVVVYSPEPFSRETAMRLLEIGTGMEVSDMLRGRISPEEAVARYTAFAQEKKSKIRLATICSLEDIYDYCSSISDLQLVVVIGPEHIYEPIGQYLYGNVLPHREPMEKVARSLRDLAQSLDVPVICTAHLHRNLERRKNKRPQLKDLEKVNLPAGVADQVIFLYRECYYNWESDRAAEIIVAKTHFGQPGTVYLQWNYETGQFLEPEAAKD